MRSRPRWRAPEAGKEVLPPVLRYAPSEAKVPVVVTPVQRYGCESLRLIGAGAWAARSASAPRIAACSTSYGAVVKKVTGRRALPLGGGRCRSAQSAASRRRRGSLDSL